MNQSIYTTHEAEQAVRVLLHHLGQDVGSPGLRDTPKRVVKALTEMTSGYLEHPKDVLGTVFEEGFDEVVICRGIPFTSLCEHHLLTFSGTADVGYLPGPIEGAPVPCGKCEGTGYWETGPHSGPCNQCSNGMVAGPEHYRCVGLSKLARLVDVFAKRLQMQERLTTQIASALLEGIGARGTAVVIRSVHSCMTCRGVKKAGAEMVTSCMLGEFRSSAALRTEFLELIRK